MTEEIMPYPTTKNEENAASLKKEIQNPIIKIKLVNGSDINGMVHIKQGFEQLSDLINSNQDPFLTLIDATIHHKDLEKGIRHKTMFVNKKHIIWATLEENEK